MTSIASSADAAPLAAKASGSNWLTRCILLAAMVLVASSVAVDLGADGTFGWDMRVNCVAVDAHLAGLDPYFVENLKDTKLSYPYLPVTLDAFRPLCAGGFLVAHYKPIYLVLAVICALLLPGIGSTRRGLRDSVLRSVFTLGGFLGFDWVIATGNFEILSGLLTAAALALLLRPARSEDGAGASLVPQLAGAAVLGLVTAFKLVFLPVLAALYFLPQPRARKLVLIAVAAGMFALPILVSLVFYPDLFRSWLSAILGQIPGQHSPVNEVNPSLLLVALTLAGRIGLADSKLAVVGLYGLIAVTLVLAPFAVHVWRMVRPRGRTGKLSLLQALDDWLVDHPEAAMRITVLAMYALYLCTPRPKEYTFFQVALYAAVLVVDLPALMMVAVLTVAVAVPSLASAAVTAFMGGYGQLTLALICFWLVLLGRPSGHAAQPHEPQRI
jgi:hypothetical protein